MSDATPLPPESFDAATVAAALVGTWRYTAAEEPSGVAYLRFAEGGRIFYFIHDPEWVGKRIPTLLHFEIESPYVLHMHSEGGAAGWKCSYKLEGDNLTLLPSGEIFSCVRLSQEEVPRWFRETSDSGLARA